MWRLGLVLLTAASLPADAPASAEDWRKAGLALLSKGDSRNAAPALQKACELDRAPGDSCYYYARTLHALGDFEAARPAFESALRMAPAPFAGRVHRATGLNYIALGRSDEAERHLRKAITLAQPDQEDARVDLGSFLFRQGRLVEARKLLDDAVRARPESARANLESGRILLHVDQAPAAVQRLEAAVRLNPADWNGHLLLGRAYQRVGRDADAERELRLGETEWRRKQP